MTTTIFIAVEVDKKERRGYDEFFRDITGFEDEFYAELPKAMKRAEVEARKTALAPLREYPDPWRSAQSKFVWSNDPKKNAKARAYWFARGKKKGNGSYNRTGNMGRAWDVNLALSSDNTYGTLRIFNKHKKASYVYGSEAFNWQRVPSHERTGWLNAGDSEQMSQAVEDTLDTFFREIAKAAAMLADGL